MKAFDGPCLLRVPSPSTWPSVLETVPKPLLPCCQALLLGWLLYQQRAPHDSLMALSVKLFKPGLSCARFGDLPYINLLDKHENMMTAVPDPLEVTPVRAVSCFCSNDSKTESGMFIGVSDCDNYTMEMSNPDHTDIYKSHPVTFRSDADPIGRWWHYMVGLLVMWQLVILRRFGEFAVIRPIYFCRLDGQDVVIWWHYNFPMRFLSPAGWWHRQMTTPASSLDPESRENLRNFTIWNLIIGE